MLNQLIVWILIDNENIPTFPAATASYSQFIINHCLVIHIIVT